MENLKNRARTLRKDSTAQENAVWQLLRNRKLNNLKFRRQHPIGKYYVDFVCIEKRLIIELDGGQHNETDKLDYDMERTKYLENKGYTVLRFWNSDVNNNIDGVYEEILKYV